MNELLAPQDALGLAAYAAAQLPDPTITDPSYLEFLFVPTGFGPIVEILVLEILCADNEISDACCQPIANGSYAHSSECGNSTANPAYGQEKPVSQAKTIIAEMRAADAAHAARNAEKLAQGTMKGLPRIPTTAKLTEGQQTAKAVLLKGTENVLDRNAMKREHSLPRRAMSMASRKGRITPDMLDSLMAFFRNPAEMAQGLLLSFLPTKVALADAKALVAERATLEGWGEAATAALLTDLPAILRGINPSTGRNGRAPSRLLICDGVTPPTVDAKRRGRPSGPKYVAFLPPIDDRPVYGCDDVAGIPGPANGLGVGTADGWFDAWAKAEAEGKSWQVVLSPAHQMRVRIALDSAHDTALKPVAEAE